MNNDNENGYGMRTPGGRTGRATDLGQYGNNVGGDRNN